MLSNEELAHIEERNSKRTQGVWRLEDKVEFEEYYGVFLNVNGILIGTNYDPGKDEYSTEDDPQALADAEFISNAPRDITLLLAEVREWREKLNGFQFYEDADLEKTVQLPRKCVLCLEVLDGNRGVIVHVRKLGVETMLCGRWFASTSGSLPKNTLAKVCPTCEGLAKNRMTKEKAKKKNG